MVKEAGLDVVSDGINWFRCNYRLRRGVPWRRRLGWQAGWGGLFAV